MFHTYVATVLSECCICLQLFFKCFSCVSDACFVRMLQLFHLDISKVDGVLCMLQYEPPAVAGC
jgi:hypothetical protein